MNASTTTGLTVAQDKFRYNENDVLHAGNYDSYLGYIGTTSVQKESKN
jgi:hypothetical protein